MGNRLTKVNNGSTTNYSYDDADQMTLADGETYSYDNDGNQAAAGADTFGWDAENGLVSTNIGGVTVTLLLYKREQFREMIGARRRCFLLPGSVHGVTIAKTPG